MSWIAFRGCRETRHEGCLMLLNVLDNSCWDPWGVLIQFFAIDEVMYVLQDVIIFSNM